LKLFVALLQLVAGGAAGVLSLRYPLPLLLITHPLNSIDGVLMAIGTSIAASRRLGLELNLSTNKVERAADLLSCLEQQALAIADIQQIQFTALENKDCMP
jgi:hypothetical protein